MRSEEHTSELQSQSNLVCRLLLEKKKKKPPSTDNSTPFTKLESSEARNNATAAISSGRPIFPRGIRDSNIRFASSVRTWSCMGVAIGPGLSTFTRIFLPFSSLSQVRANERNAALLAAYTP